jgi:hypothetical protein
MSQEIFTDGVLEAGKQLSGALLLGVAFSAAAALQKLHKDKNIKLFDFTIPRRYFFYAAIAYTGFHLYACVVFASICRQAMAAGASHACADALRLKGPLIFLGMSPRVIVGEWTIGTNVVLPLVYIPTRDPTTWLYHVFLGLISFACWQASRFASIRVTSSGCRPFH